MLLRWAVLSIALFWMVPCALNAGIYRWVDSNGDVHFGDRIPEAYQDQGETVDISRDQPSASDRKAAEAVAESARKAANDARKRRLEQQPSTIDKGQQPEIVKPKKANNWTPITPQAGQSRLTHEQEMKNYEAEMRRYKESQRCFAPYKIMGGATKGEAFKHCTPMDKPRHPDVR